MAMKKSNMLVWGLLVLLVLGLGGFGATNFTGNVTNIGEVGGKPIRINAYTRGVQDQMAQLQQQMGQPISFAQAQAFGITNSVVAGLVNDRALDNEADRLGLSIGDEELRDQIVKIRHFRMLRESSRARATPSPSTVPASAKRNSNPTCGLTQPARCFRQR